MNNQASIKFVLGGKPLSNGQYLVYLRITKNRKKKEISLGIKCKKEDFINEQFLKSHRNYKIENELLFKFKQKAFEIIRTFQLNDDDYSLNDFESIFRGKSVNNENFLDFINEIISDMEKSKRIGNARAYKEAKSSLIRFLKDSKSITTVLKFKEITPEFLEKFEVYMRSRGNDNGGISFKMRQIRAVFNRAINRKLISQDLYPFKFYKISKLKSKPNKRALTIDEFKKFKSVDLSKNPLLVEAYNYFMFSFYTRGMNFVDIMHLKKSDIINGRINYTRSKTKGKFNIEIVDNAQKIIDYYKTIQKDSQYIFPILLNDNMSPTQIAYREQKVLARVNKKLKEISKLAGIEKKNNYLCSKT